MGLPFFILTIGATFGVFAFSHSGEAKPSNPAAVVQGPLLDEKVCLAAIQSVERTLRLPSQLLGAIGMVESGRVNSVTGQIGPWPWTINVGGIGYFYDTKDQAITAVQGYLAKGMQSIDVGCMQVNLSYHPTAFASLEEAFDPLANTNYAARLLLRLYSQSHLWGTAAAAYHSQTPGVSDNYVRRVVAAWPLAVKYIEPAVLAAISTNAAPSNMRIAPASICIQPDLNRYTPEFRKVVIQASLDHARLLADRGVATQSKAAVGCKMLPIAGGTELSHRFRDSQFSPGHSSN